MNNKKCPNCGFINFVKDEVCRKCETTLDSVPMAEPTYPSTAPVQYGAAPSPYAGGGAPASYTAGAPSYAPGAPSYAGGAPSYAGGAPSYSSAAPSYAGAPPNSYAAPSPFPNTYAPGSANPYLSGQYYQYQTKEKAGFPVAKVTVGVVIGFLILASLTGAGAAFLKRQTKVQWREFRAEGSNVVVMMPKEPKAHEAVVTPMTSGSITNHTYTATILGQGSTMYSVVDFTFTFEVADAAYQRMLDAEFNDLLKRTNAVVINRQNITINGFPGVQFETTPLDNVSQTNRRSFGKMFMARNQLYLLAITANEGSELLQGKDKFLNLQVPPS